MLVQGLIGGCQQFVMIIRRQRDVTRAQAADRGLRRGHRRAQVVADCREQRRPAPVGLGDGAARLRRRGEPLLPERGGGEGSERAQASAAGGGQRPPAERQAQAARGRDRHGRIDRPGYRWSAGDSYRRPADRAPGEVTDAGTAFQEGH